MTRPNDFDEYFVHQIPRAAPERRASTTSTGGRATSSTSTTRAASATSSSSPWRTFPARERIDSLQIGRVGGEPVLGYLQRPAVRRRPAHEPMLEGASIEIVEPWEEVRLRVDPSRGRDRARLDVPGPHPAVRPAARHDARRRGPGVGPVPHLQSGTYRARTPSTESTRSGRRLDRPARPLVGHPRPLPLPAVAVVPDPARRRHARRLALGARERRAHLHRRLLGRRGRQRAGAGGRLLHTTSIWVGADGGPRSTASTVTTVDRTRAARVVHAGGRPARSRSRQTARSPVRTSRSIAAGST